MAANGPTSYPLVTTEDATRGMEQWLAMMRAAGRQPTLPEILQHRQQWAALVGQPNVRVDLPIGPPRPSPRPNPVGPSPNPVISPYRPTPPAVPPSSGPWRGGGSPDPIDDWQTRQMMAELDRIRQLPDGAGKTALLTRFGQQYHYFGPGVPPPTFEKRPQLNSPPGSPGTNQIRTGDPVVGRQPYGNDNVVGRTIPYPPPGSPPVIRSAAPTHPTWEEFSKQNYKPGVNMLQLRNNYMASQRPPTGSDKPGMTRSPGFAGGGTVLSAGQRLQNIKMGLRPSTYYNMLPSARQFTEGAVSALGMPPEDFWKDLEQGYPVGPNPNQGITAGFQDGGKISIKHGPDGSFEYKRG